MNDDDTAPGVLLLIAFLMVLALAWQNIAYRGVPDAAGRTFDNCAVEVAGFAWGCGKS